MALKVKFRSGRVRTSTDEAYQLALLQPRVDREGHKIQGHTFDEIMAMTLEQRRHFSDTVWLHQQWLKTQKEREAAYERSKAFRGSAKRD